MQESENMSDISSGAPVPSIVHLDALPVGTRLAEFELQSLLGVGGFGMVYRAYDHSLHRTIAIKEYMPAALVSRQNGLAVSIRSAVDRSTYESGLKSFVGEARLLAQFDHPSLVKVYRFWEANNTAYMAMPLYRGMTLKQARSQMAAPPSEAWLRVVLWSILQALQVLHRHDTLHRDVSPDNIFLQDIGPPVLLDLGAARRAIGDRSHKLTAILKVNYAPIEQYANADNLHQGPWTDLYSLAAVAYTCLRNDPPLQVTSRIVRDDLLPLSSVVKTVQEHFRQSYSDEFVRTVTHALAIQPADRPQDVQAFVDEMRLQPVEDLAKFDWRAEMARQLPPARDDSLDSMWPTEMLTEVTEDLSKASPAGAGHSLVARWATARADFKRMLGRPRRWVAAALVTLAAVGLWTVLGTELADDAPLVAAPEPAPVPDAVATLPQLPDAPAIGPTVDPAPTPGVTETAIVPGPAPMIAPVAQAVATPVEPKKKLSNPVRDKADSKSRQARKPASAPANAAPPVARELCANSNFFLRPMCIHSECQKEQNAKLPVCVEDRLRYPSGPGASAP